MKLDFNLNPAVATAKHANDTNGQTVLEQRPCPCRVKGETWSNTGVCLFFSRGSRGSRFGPTAVFRMMTGLSSLFSFVHLASGQNRSLSSAPTNGWYAVAASADGDTALYG